jgi:hypothetical protein
LRAEWLAMHHETVRAVMTGSACARIRGSDKVSSYALQSLNAYHVGTPELLNRKGAGNERLGMDGDELGSLRRHESFS